MNNDDRRQNTESALHRVLEEYGNIVGKLEDELRSKARVIMDKEATISHYKEQNARFLKKINTLEAQKSSLEASISRLCTERSTEVREAYDRGCICQSLCSTHKMPKPKQDPLECVACLAYQRGFDAGKVTGTLSGSTSAHPWQYDVTKDTFGRGR